MSMDWREPLVSLCREMIRRPSLSGQEKEMADFVERSMQELGFDSVERDHYGNVSGRIVLGSGGRRLFFTGQMDT